MQFWCLINCWPKVFRPPPPSLKKGPTDGNVCVLYLMVIIKFGFFKISTPPLPISPECLTPQIYTIEVAPKVLSLAVSLSTPVYLLHATNSDPLFLLIQSPNSIFETKIRLNN